ncbi:hypothetical protein MUN88_06315 [Gracilibacillus caseinilyticus]|uniref:Phospholipid phosphatase n=1 Tax=Gracilibacillus caseinilyticus TaxID=2932256 RepID=A0ABY4EZ62_9BACI|nr:hypothetical protein [Gracilibacillus caseinilyticus]UOQ49690.1 hypothetical protein MUN88_06315 [Gracilibacillus caseinilyticus]
MDSYVYLLYTVIYAALFIYGLLYTPTARIWSWCSFLFLVMVGLVFDNAVIALGKFIGEGPILENLNLLRYWSHALFTPTLVLYCFGILQIKGRLRTILFVAFLAVTICLILFEIRFEVLHLSLQPQWEYGVLRYAPIEDSNGPPLMILIVTMVLLITGLVIWMRRHWPWMFAGVLLMAMGSIVKIPINSSAITNGFELILIITLFLTKTTLENKSKY